MRMGKEREIRSIITRGKGGENGEKMEGEALRKRWSEKQGKKWNDNEEREEGEKKERKREVRLGKEGKRHAEKTEWGVGVKEGKL